MCLSLGDDGLNIEHADLRQPVFVRDNGRPPLCRLHASLTISQDREALLFSGGGSVTGKIINLNLAERQDEPQKELDFDFVKELAINNIESVLSKWMPGGVLRGHEYICGGIGGNKGESCSTNINTGVGSDFATGEKWGDIIELVAKTDRTNMKEAAESLASFMGVDPYRPYQLPPRQSKELSQDDKYAIGRIEAERLWNEAGTCPHHHPYLLKKQIMASNDIKLHHKEGILIPLRNENGELTAVQRIDSKGEKKVSHNGKMTGSFHVLPGQPDTVYICEGYATAWTVQYITGKTVVMAVSAGNLESVGKKICKMYPTSQIVWAADWDGIDGGPGVAAANKAAEKCKKGVVVPPPYNDTRKGDWNDFAIDNGAEECKAYLIPKRDPQFIRLSDFFASRFDSNPPPVRWMVEPVFRRGAAYLLAGMGDVGKGYLTLHLANAVSLLGGIIKPSSFGGNVINSGTSVIISCEDDAEVYHHRIAAIDQAGNRHKKPSSLILIPLPNAGGTRPFVIKGKDGLEVTPFYTDFKRQLVEIPDLMLVVMDTLQGLFQCDFNADPAAGQFCAGVLQELATVTGATIIANHHMRKPSGEIDTPAQAREAIRGTTAIIDGLRGAYCLWPCPDSKAGKIAKDMGLKFTSNLVVRGAMVKANNAETRHVRTFVRNQFGLLEDRTEELREPANEELVSMLSNAMATTMMPFNKSGTRGIFERRDELPGALKILPRKKLHDLFDVVAGMSDDND